MADFTLNDVNTVATQMGVPPDYVRQQLQAEGHNVLEDPIAQPAPAAPAPGVFDVYTGEVPAEAPPAVGTPDEFAAMLQQQSGQAVAGMQAAQVPAHLRQRMVPVQTAPAAAPARVAGVRARGTRTQPQQAGGEGGSFGRARKLLDARERQLGAEYEDAARQYQEGGARLSLLDDERMSFAQQRADIEARYAEQRAGVADQMARSQVAAAQQEAVARERENQALAAREAQLEKGRRELVDMKVKGPSLGARLTNAIAVALANYGDAISSTGGVDTNYAASTQAVINDAMDRALMEQLRVIDEKKGALNAEEQSIVRMREQFGNDAAFRDYMRSVNRDAMVARIEQLAAESDNETTKLAAQALATDWKAASETEAQKGRGAALEEARKRLRGAADDRFGFELGIAMPKAGDGKKATPAAGGLMQTGDATSEDRKKAQEIASKFGGVVSTLDDLRDMSRRYPNGSLDTTARDFIALKLEDYMGQNSQAFGKGTPQEAEAQRQLSRLADPSAIFTTADAERLYEMLTQSTLRNADAQMRPYNFSMVPDQSGFEVE